MGRTQQFLSEVEAAIGGSVPAERRNEILAETYAHLEDRAEDLAFGGAMSEEKAEEEALTAFGSAKTYARNVAESFYEDGPRRRVRKLALASALLCCALPMLSRVALFNPWYRTALLERPDKLLYSQDVIIWGTLSLMGSLCLGILGRKSQAGKISLIFLGLLAVCFAYLGRYSTLSDDRQFFYPRSQLQATVTDESRQTGFTAYLQEVRLTPLIEAQQVFTAAAPIPARWRLADGTFPVPPPATKKHPEFALSRFQNKLSAEYAVRSEQEARRRWREDGNRTIQAMRDYIQHVEASHARLMVIWQAMLAKPFHPMAALVQLIDSVAIWMLVILCDSLGASLGRWVHRKTWKTKPSVPRKGAAA